ncbi:aminotransferase [Lacticaseibacillus zeae DSM 20178 = KCTC 3804]|uniref:cysteine-S-conjugate beta-lyase n=1 Tax=Lacticaseibacillus zeae DSM 20178 = KCTC 3804 TaxID=1423816 RepID=A0A0R1EZT9_LACZE|nr:PatB family C-S lyase [Lacticaseibacillus zeae]KRK12426.1 aminotransferase [Lacticaseibacillus zeae DSM 20178 = KCTC 3804]OLS04710.1 aminotransferase [Lacticaseibacillus casei]QVI32354.1 PatB family C-S lyase [Lacticaseibacillus zeae]
MSQFDTLFDRKAGNARKWADQVLAEKFGLTPHAIPMDLADLDFPVAPPIHQAMMARAAVPDYSYTYIPEAFYAAVIAWNARRFGLKLEKDWIKLSYGTVPTLHYLVQAFTAPGEGVLINTPAYDPFAEAVQNNHRQLVTSPLVLKEGQYFFDYTDMATKMQRPDVKLFILCSPQNPSGRVWTAAELAKVAELCRQHHVLLVSDEIHRDIVYPGVNFTSIWQADPAIQSQSILCLSPNKAFNLGGLKTSYVVIPEPAIRDRLSQQFSANSITSPNSFAVPALIAAYTDCDAWLDEMVAYVAANFDYLKKRLAAIPEMKVMPAESGFLAWIDTHRLFPDEASMKQFFTPADLSCVVGSYFVADGDGFVRLNIGMPRPLLKEAVDRILATYAKWPTMEKDPRQTERITE